jgi:hypothetical protein
MLAAAGGAVGRDGDPLLPGAQESMVATSTAATPSRTGEL